MKGILKKLTALVLVAVFILTALIMTGCGKKTIVIYTSAEDFRTAQLQKRMAEEFPELDIVFEYKSSGDHAAILKSAGKNAECHITYDLEYGYAEEMVKLGILADLTGIADFSQFTDDAVPTKYYTPSVRVGSGVIVNLDVIEEKGLDIPESYEDLLDPQYKGLISMPSPKASGTGYVFLFALAKAWGEKKALDYFDALSENVLSFTSSGSGPVNALVGKEVAIGFGMISHAVQQINEGENLKILTFDEGHPYTLYGQGIIAGNETDEDVVRVYKFLSTTLTEEQLEMFYPEKLFKDKDFVIENFPSNIKYADMSGNNAGRKSELIAKWAH